MTFDSRVFLIFFALFFPMYYLLARHLRCQNLLILTGSFLFYGWWDWRYLCLMIFSTGVDYVAGLGMMRSTHVNWRRLWLWSSLGCNLTILFTFKYFDFFSASLSTGLAALGWEISAWRLGFLLPVGVSFYTFQSMAYTIDVYRGEIAAEKDPTVFFAFITFFPQLVAGPIERARDLLPQFCTSRVLTAERCREAVWYLVWGYFCKEVIADPVALIVDASWARAGVSGGSVVVGTLGFGLQIYADFLAYSTIARGLAGLLGFRLRSNFNHPYFAPDIREFWHRWHMTLSTWLRDYVYIPLGGNRRGYARTQVNLMATMLLGGLWHGAAWNFVIWGGLHGAALVLQRLWHDRRPLRRPLPAAVNWALTMLVVFAGWFLFRCRGKGMLWAGLQSLLHPTWSARETSALIGLAVLTLPLLLLEVWQVRWRDDAAPLRLRPCWYGALSGAMAAMAFAMFERFQYAFIYFQF